MSNIPLEGIPKQIGERLTSKGVEPIFAQEHSTTEEWIKWRRRQLMSKANYPGLGKYRVIQRGVNRFDIQRKYFGLIWLNVTEFGSYSLDDAMQTLNEWQADKEVAGRVVWP